MGLDTTHNCWHGPYSAFSRWRQRLHTAITGEAGDQLEVAWEKGFYDNPCVPINILMNHSDNDGSILHEDTLAVAEALELLIPSMRGSDEFDETAVFAAGLRLAHSRGEDVEFR